MSEKVEKKNREDIKYLIQQFSKLTTSKDYELPSSYIERVRYLDKDISPSLPGYYKFDNTPYWKEPLDMLSPLSPVQKVVIIKGVQIGYSTGVLENLIAYNIGRDPKPTLFVTTNKDLMHTTMEIKIERMIDSCGLRDLIFAQTQQRSKKTGDTTFKKQYPGGYLIGIGAQEPGSLRAMTFPCIVMDELDSYPDKLKGEGDPVSLADNRTNSCGDKRKILYGSTPLILQSSKTWRLFKKGDQRYYYVPCKFCGEMQILKWHGVTEDGWIYGIVYEIENGRPIIDTVGYKCINPKCGKIMKNDDKSIIFQSGEWRPTAETQERGLVSYQISALYSSPAMFSWEKCVEKWIDAWDIEKNRLKEKEKYREFRNLIQGLPYEELGESIKSERAQLHRRGIYLKNQIPNTIIIQETGSPVLFLTAAVDVQLKNIFVDVKAWANNGANYTIDFFSIEGDVEKSGSKLWQELNDILENRKWVADDGKIYKINQTLIDSGYGKYTDQVYFFCKRYEGGVFAVKGRDWIDPGLPFCEFSEKTKSTIGLKHMYHVNTTIYKDKIAYILQRLSWNSGEFQPAFYPNFPDDFRDDYFEMFEAEEKRDITDKLTNKFQKTAWIHIYGRENHALDTFVYSLANVEIFADYCCRNYLGLPALEWSQFWEFCKQGYFYELPEGK